MNTGNFYTKLGAIYHDPGSLMSRKIRLVERMLVPGDTLLDVGCGTGAFINMVKVKYKRITGVDADERAVALCARRFKGQKHIALRQLAAESIGTLNEQYDAVACLDVLEHLDDPGRALDGIHALLVPGGQLIVTMPNWYNRIVAFLVRDKLHKHFHSSLGWATLLRRHSFIVRDIRTVAFPAVDREFLSRRMHMFGMCVVISAFKAKNDGREP